MKVLWPAPKRFTDQYSTTVGYKDELVLPLIVHAKDTSKPVDLKLKLFIGVCEDICVPVNASLRETVPGAGGATQAISHDRLISYFFAKVPGNVPSGNALTSAHPLGVKQVKLVGGGKASKLQIDAVFPKGASRRDIFTEAPSGVYLPRPKLVSNGGAGDRISRFEVDLSRSGGAKAMTGKALTVTLVSDHAQGEVSLPVK